MPSLSQLENGDAGQVIRSAVQRGSPVTLTVLCRDSWVSLHSRFLAAGEGGIWLEMPTAADGAQQELSTGQRVGVNFKHKHHKHIFSTAVAGTAESHLEDGSRGRALVVAWPERMERLQRRAYVRAEVPPNRIVRVSFWLGGRQHEPAGTSPEHPVYSGSVIDISAGGFSAATDLAAGDVLETGDTVGVRLAFGAGGATVFADAQLRHAEPSVEGKCVMGFQFVALAESAEGKDALALITAKVTEFQRAWQHAV
jgi:c-di-GMP-binding flagellar brake protein YcgR